MFDKESTRLRRYATAELLAANLSNSQIAKVFKQSKAVVNADRQLIKQAYVDGILATADQWRAKLLDEQGELKAKAMESFEQSKRRTVKRVQQRHGEDVITVEEYNSAGESSFLTVAKGCLEQQARLLGLFDNKPKNDDNDEKSYKKFLANLSAEVKKIGKAEAAAQDRAGAIDTTAEAELDDNGEPVGNSRPMLPATDDEEQDDEG
jgi:transposase